MNSIRPNELSIKSNFIYTRLWTITAYLCSKINEFNEINTFKSVRVMSGWRKLQTLRVTNEHGYVIKEVKWQYSYIFVFWGRVSSFISHSFSFANFKADSKCHCVLRQIKYLRVRITSEGISVDNESVWERYTLSIER